MEVCPWCRIAVLVDLDQQGRQVVKCRNPQCIRYNKILTAEEGETHDRPGDLQGSAGSSV